MEYKERHPSPFLEFMPVSLFGAVMGLTALCFAWRLADEAWHVGSVIGEVIGYTAILVFIILFIAYTVKWFHYPETVKNEFNNPGSMSFFATITISILLIPGILLPYSRILADAIWFVGVAITLFFAWFVLRKWMHKQQPLENAVPAWVLPITGTLNVPIVGDALHFRGAHEICLMFFGFGIIFIMVMMSILFSRFFFAAPLPDPLKPSLMILVAPFALAFSGYQGLIEGQDITASAFFYFSLAMLLLFGSAVWLLPRCCPFKVSWWSVSFPLGSVTVACFRYSKRHPDVAHSTLAGLMITLTSLVIGYLLIQTLYQIATRRYGQPASPAAVPRTAL
jgi:tellurite resistance protein